VNQGGEPGHDDYGLPSVDIQVPDDARDLYRDVQAYHRELRALRRQERSKRWRAPLSKGGLLVPVIAGFLVLAMITGMILTMFSTNPSFSRIAGPPQGPPSSPHASSTLGGGSGKASTRPTRATATDAAGQVTRLPAMPIVVSAHKPLTLSTPTAAAIALIPAKCRCSGAIRRLLGRAMSVGVTVYLEGSRSARIAALSSLAPALYKSTAMVAVDASNTLAKSYSSRRLEILLVDARGDITLTSGLQPRLWTKRTLSELRQSG
jgi:hypothetical protein